MDYLSGWCKSKRRLDGHTAIVTGSNTGIGKETVKDLYSRGARVIMACRNLDKAEKAKEDIEKTTASQENRGVLLLEELDLSKLKSVRHFCDRISENEKAIQILVNNAGIMMCPEDKTEDGLELQIGTNHFGHALLTLLLLPKIIDSGPSRIIFVSSYLHKDYNINFQDFNFETEKYEPLKAYSRSKAANVLFSKALANKLKENNINNVTTYSLHPGIITTELGRHFSDTVWYGATWAFNNLLGLFLKSPVCGAQTSIYCAVDEMCENESGLYYADCKKATPSVFCQSDESAQTLWDRTIEILKLTNYNPFSKSHSSIYD